MEDNFMVKFLSPIPYNCILIIGSEKIKLKNKNVIQRVH